MNSYIDFHTHAFPDNIAEKAIKSLTEHSGKYKPYTDGKISSLLNSMDIAKIDKAFIANIATKAEQFSPIMSWSKTIKSERLIPLASVHPKSKNLRSEFENIVIDGIPGIKLHPMYQNFKIDDSIMFDIYSMAQDLGLFVIFHSGHDIAFPGNDNASPARLRVIIENFPRLTIISTHCGGWDDYNTALEYVIGTEIFLETSFISELNLSEIDTILKKHNPDKILFGSDSPWLDQKSEVLFIENLNISDDLKEKILFKNASMFFCSTKSH